MKYHELDVTADRKPIRSGRGIAAGRGKTAGRGTKGQNARTGKKLGATFAGGQTPIVRAIPHLKGFKSLRTPAQVVYADQIDALDAETIDNHVLHTAGLIATPYSAVKVIARGTISRQINLKVSGASDSVRQQLTAKGGTFEKTAVPLKQSTKKSV